jgi:hypothetical protein
MKYLVTVACTVECYATIEVDSEAVTSSLLFDSLAVIVPERIPTATFEPDKQTQGDFRVCSVLDDVGSEVFSPDQLDALFD